VGGRRGSEALVVWYEPEWEGQVGVVLRLDKAWVLTASEEQLGREWRRECAPHLDEGSRIELLVLV
jgi:hypothetical protein